MDKLGMRSTRTLMRRVKVQLLALENYEDTQADAVETRDLERIEDHLKEAVNALKRANKVFAQVGGDESAALH